MKDGDLLAYGIIVNETLQHTPGGPAHSVNGVAMRENMQSTLQYRAFFTLSQTPTGEISFNGMLRTSAKMSENDELMLQLKRKDHWFDIDFENAYKDTLGAKDDFLKYWRPCYKINSET
jgi:hypothetical protein